jgi:esterase
MRLRDVTQGEPADSRPPVVLLHGLFGQARNFGGLQKSLAARGKRVIALDLRNHGDSPHATDTGYAAMAADVVETLAALDALPCRLLDAPCARHAGACRAPDRRGYRAGRLRPRQP